MAIADLRREYRVSGLRRSDLAKDPIVQFKIWFQDASGKRGGGRLRKFFIGLYKSLLMLGGASPIDFNAMTLATVDAQGQPSARVVLLKGVDERGFIFFTNYESRKGTELAGNSQAALVFYWSDVERQICVSGTVAKLPAAESDAYFQTRPIGSQIAAWASQQSCPVRDRAELEARWEEFERLYPSPEVPRPSHWGGYVLAPTRIEFWQGRPNRLHDRFVYVRQPDGSWTIERLFP